MNLTVKEVLRSNPSIKTKDGKEIFYWDVSCNIDGKDYPLIALKAWSSKDIKANDSFEVKINEYNGATSYFIIDHKQPSNNKGYGKPVYTQQEYDSIFKSGFKVVLEELPVLISKLNNLKINITSSDITMLICNYNNGACNHGVKINSASPTHKEVLDDQFYNENIDNI